MRHVPSVSLSVGSCPGCPQQALRVACRFTAMAKADEQACYEHVGCWPLRCTACFMIR